ncbi:hypothetical protein VHEMI03006 [[Torrubiella] hemipterigena]|uniref:Endonuclease/exonuclease/phosphatase domain-containing protein n=1 Tax=[Torrubiella] hemipterigena TaxID=1531966 RepID=A0A0A1T9U7_9HYPO|nr:hypothetical protein VHEMI03006 [[Torrubiella] hemipterigena]
MFASGGVQYRTVITVQRLSAAAAAAGNSLVYNPNKAAVTFDYTVAAVDSTNWVALYKGTNNPKDGSKYSYSAWVFAPDAKGSAYINAVSLDEGDYNYYAGGVKPVASEPIVFGKPNVAPNTADNEWPTDHAAFIADFTF